MKKISESTNEWLCVRKEGSPDSQNTSGSKFLELSTMDYERMFISLVMSSYSHIQQTMISRKQRSLNTLQNELVNNSKIIQETVSGIPDFSQLSPLNPKVHLHVEPSHFPPFLHSPQPLLKTADKI